MQFKSLHWLSHDDIGAMIIQLSYTVRILIFRLVDLYHVKLGCDETKRDNFINFREESEKDIRSFWNFKLRNY